MPTATINPSNNSSPQLLLGLKGLESHVDHDLFMYILHSLYQLIFNAKEMGDTKKQLQRRIRRFEAQSQLPPYLSAIPIDECLLQLEDAQFFYPIRRREVTFPTFH